MWCRGWRVKVVCVFAHLQVKSGTIFDNFLVTDDEEYAKQMAKDTWGATKDPEKKMKEKVGWGVGADCGAWLWLLHSSGSLWCAARRRGEAGS